MINIDCIITEGGIIEAMMGEDLTIYVDIIESGPQGPKGEKGDPGEKGEKGDPGVGGGSIVDLGTFYDVGALIDYILYNQLPTGHYTFVVNENEAPVFMLLERGQDGYYGTFHDSVADFYYFEVSFYGEIIELKSIYLKDLMTDVSL